jgi:hypothetical protein
MKIYGGGIFYLVGREIATVSLWVHLRNIPALVTSAHSSSVRCAYSILLVHSSTMNCLFT